MKQQPADRTFDLEYQFFFSFGLIEIIRLRFTAKTDMFSSKLEKKSSFDFDFLIWFIKKNYFTKIFLFDT